VDYFSRTMMMMIKILVYIYRLVIMPPTSLVLNVYFYFKYEHIWQQSKAAMQAIVNGITNLDHVKRFVNRDGFVYRPDPAMTSGLTWNYVHWSDTLFYIRQGDCSTWARQIKRLLKKIGIKARLYMIMDGWHLEGSHVVCLFNIHDTVFMYNVTQLIVGNGHDTDQAMLEQFRSKRLTSYGKYNDLRVFKWF
jgi:hypothetical protein